MKIAVNTRLLIKNKLEGIGWFATESLKRITQEHPEHEFIFIFDRPYDEEFIFSDNITPVVAGPITRHPVLWWFWLQFVIPRILKKHKADIFVSPDGFLSLRSNVPSLPVIHDINFEYYPEQLPYFGRKFYKKYFPAFAQKAKRIGTVSEYSKSDISKQYGVNKSKIDVYYNGANSLYRPASEGKKQSVRDDLTGGSPYFIFVGALNPRKNIPGLLEAFDKFRSMNNDPHKLVIVGNAMHKTEAIKKTLEKMSYSDEVIFTGRLNAEILSGVMSAATALVFIPLFEGFGIPLIEAMYAETPIICSNKTSLPEVVEDAAILTDPENPSETASAMEKIAHDENTRKVLIEKARERRKNFTWDKTAANFWKSIEKCINEIEQ